MQSPDPASVPFTLDNIIKECGGKGNRFPVSAQHVPFNPMEVKF